MPHALSEVEGGRGCSGGIVRPFEIVTSARPQPRGTLETVFRPLRTPRGPCFELVILSAQPGPPARALFACWGGGGSVANRERAKDLERAFAAHTVNSSAQYTAWARMAPSRFFASLRMTVLENNRCGGGWPGLSTLHRPKLLRVGIFAFKSQMSRLIPRATWRQAKVKTPTLTSNSATLGWGTLEIFARMEDSAHPTL